MRKRIFKRLLIIGVLGIFIASIVVSLGYYYSWKKSFFHDLQQEDALLVSYDNEAPLTASFLNSIVEKTGRDLRITIINPDGTIYYESDYAKEKMDNHNNRSEVEAANRNQIGYAQRQSLTLHEDNYYVAMKTDRGQIIRVARVGSNIYHYLWIAIPITSFLIFLICIGSYFVAKYLTKSFMKPLESTIELLAKDSFSEDNDREALKELTMYKELAPLANRLYEQKQDIYQFIDILEEERTILQRVIWNITEGIILTDQYGYVLTCNQRSKKFFGFTNACPLKKSHLNDLSAEKEWRNHVETLLLGEDVSSYETEVNGIFYRIGFHAIREREKITNYLIIVFDITADYTAAMRRREFTSNVSHELKTPLTTISGYGEVLSNQLFQSKDEAAMIGEHIYKAAQKMLNLIDSIMHLSQVEDKRDQLEWEHLSVTAILQECWGQLKPKWQGKNIDFIITGEDVNVLGNKALLDEVFQNLLDNAIKFGDKTQKITVSMMRTEKEVSVSVTDTGRGIREEQIPRIFERFYRGDASRSAKKVAGTGIGLSLVKHIVEIHNGTITVASTVGIGTTFTITFPKS